MIQKLPTKIKLPNYDVSVEFVAPPPEILEGIKEDSSKFHRYGDFDLRTYHITVMQTNKDFDPYSYILFLTAAIAFCQDIKLSSCKLSILSFFLYYIFSNNDIKAHCIAVRQNKDMRFNLNLPAFIISVVVSSDYKDAPGCVSISDRIIKINTDVSSKVKPVILMHELVEWVNGMFSLGFPHTTVQNLSEILVYIVTNNEFVS